MIFMSTNYFNRFIKEEVQTSFKTIFCATFNKIWIMIRILSSTILRRVCYKFIKFDCIIGLILEILSFWITWMER